MSTVVVIPTYNEAENIRNFVEKLLALPVRIDILIVDDSSPDGTGAIADKLASENPCVSVLHRSEKNGLGKAYVEAFRTALQKEYTHIAQMDVDGSHDPADLARLLEHSTNYDCVVGSRWVVGGRVEGWPLKRQLISRIGNAYVQRMLSLGLKDSTAGFRVYSATSLKALDLDKISASGYGFQVEMSFKLKSQGATFLEVPIVFRERELGYSKMTSKIVMEALFLVTKWSLVKTHKRG